MPARLVICPVDVTDFQDGTGTIGRSPRVESTADLGKPGAMCVFNAAISDGLPGQENDFCFCVVAAIDLSAVDADPEIETLFEIGDDQPYGDLYSWLDKTPAILGWNQNKINGIKNRISGRGASAAGLSGFTPLWVYANRIAQRYSPNPSWDIRRVRTRRAGA